MVIGLLRAPSVQIKNHYRSGPVHHPPCTSFGPLRPQNPTLCCGSKNVTKSKLDERKSEFNLMPNEYIRQSSAEYKSIQTNLSPSQVCEIIQADSELELFLSGIYQELAFRAEFQKSGKNMTFAIIGAGLVCLFFLNLGFNYGP